MRKIKFRGKKCGKEFSTRDDRVKYCSTDCRLNHVKKEFAEYQRKYRAEKKYGEMKTDENNKSVR